MRRVERAVVLELGQHQLQRDDARRVERRGAHGRAGPENGFEARPRDADRLEFVFRGRFLGVEGRAVGERVPPGVSAKDELVPAAVPADSEGEAGGAREVQRGVAVAAADRGEAAVVGVGERPAKDARRRGRIPFPFPGAWLYDQNNIPVLHILDIDPFDGDMLRKVNALTYPRPVESMYGTGAIDHIAFAADDYDGMIAKLDSEQIRYKSQHVVSWLKQLFVLDPNGIVIELNFQVGERPQ